MLHTRSVKIATFSPYLEFLYQSISNQEVFKYIDMVIFNLRLLFVIAINHLNSKKMHITGEINKSKT